MEVVRIITGRQIKAVNYDDSSMHSKKDILFEACDESCELIGSYSYSWFN